MLGSQLACYSRPAEFSSLSNSPDSHRHASLPFQSHRNAYAWQCRQFQTRSPRKVASNARHSRCITRLRAESQDESASQEGGPNSLLSVFCPLLKVVSGGDAAAPRNRFLEVATSGLASMSRLAWGSKAGEAGTLRESDPKQPLLLYEFEACPFCRRVREAITDLDLPAVEVRPCPKDAARHRGEVLQRGGRAQFPYLSDPNTGRELYESDAIVKYLYEIYGAGASPPAGLLESTLFTGWMPTLLRAGRGMSRYERAVRDAPTQLLQLYNYENNQFARLVREALCELELPYLLVSAGKGSRHREQLRQLSGATTVPYLVDPNTGVSMGDSEKIVPYLFKTYGQQ